MKAYPLLIFILILVSCQPDTQQSANLITAPTDYRLIAHRGGIVEGRYTENSPAAVRAAIDRRYYMLEVDVRESKDGKLVVHHDEDFQRFYGDPRKVANMTWEEISQLRSQPGNRAPIQFEDMAKLCAGHLQLMMDTKPPSHSPEFYAEMERILREYELLDQAYFIGTAESREYFKGKAKISIKRDQLKAAVEAGEDVSELYFLFEHGNELDKEAVAYAQKHGVAVVPSVNLFHYKEEDPMEGARGDIEWLKEAGISDFQIDSEYDKFVFASANASGLSQGPFLGHINQNQARIWARAGKEETLSLHWKEKGSAETKSQNREAKLEADYTLIWDLEGLKPDTEYEYQIGRAEDKLEQLPVYSFSTAALDNEINEVSIALLSCVHDDAYEPAPTWDRLREKDPDILLLIGDTPYIDATNLDYQHRRYREFFSVSELQNIIQSIPLYSVWDDHDFGKNDTDGNLPGKENSRTAFTHYRANPSYGNGKQGIYTSFRRGPVEVFILDVRWFAGTEPSPTQPDKVSILGIDQWDWLKKGLKNSDAEFKVLASSMIWNGATRPNKPDHWGNYPHEKEALFNFIGENDISGVVLIGGDIHRSRILRYPTTSSAGYDITELIISPFHESVIDAANAPHPALIADYGLGHTYLILQASGRGSEAVLSANFYSSDSLFHKQEIPYTEVGMPAGEARN